VLSDLSKHLRKEASSCHVRPPCVTVSNFDGQHGSRSNKLKTELQCIEEMAFTSSVVDAIKSGFTTLMSCRTLKILRAAVPCKQILHTLPDTILYLLKKAVLVILNVPISLQQINLC
jgi:hypothetical protein